jgi:hypothetical protein
MKLRRSKKWFKDKINQEDNYEVGAGNPNFFSEFGNHKCTPLVKQLLEQAEKFREKENHTYLGIYHIKMALDEMLIKHPNLLIL